MIGRESTPLSFLPGIKNMSSDRRIAIVTGASRGIGEAIARRLGADGHLVVLVSRSADRLEEVRGAIDSDGGVAEVVVCDMSDGEAVREMVEGVAERHGEVDILVNNAGITRDGLLMRMSDEDFDEVIAVNLRAVFIACRTAARPMMKHRFGRIINIGSVTGVTGNAGQANYAAAKAGLTGLTKSIARELGGKGITANVIAPGFVATDMIGDLPQAKLDELVKSLPLRRLGQPEEIAHTASFLASDLAGYITGQVLLVDGGMAC